MHDMPMMATGRRLPSVYFRELDLPEVKEWEIGEKYQIVIQVEMLGKENMKADPAFNKAPQKDKRSLEGHFQIVSLKAVGGNDKHSRGKKGYL